MEQADLLRRLIEVFERLDIPYMLVGSIASGAYGEPRLTQDIDVVADVTRDDIQTLISEFPQDEYYLSPEAAVRAVRDGGQFNVIHPASGNKIDILLPGRDAWGRLQFSRRQRVRVLPDQGGYTARPEDIIISKMQYYREGGSEKHLRDITGILKVSGDRVDRQYVTQWAEKLGLCEIWQAIFRRVKSDGLH